MAATLALPYLAASPVKRGPAVAFGETTVVLVPAEAAPAMSMEEEVVLLPATVVEAYDKYPPAGAVS